MRVVTLDFETYWSSKVYTLSKMGPIEYIRDPRFSAQMMSYTVYDSTKDADCHTPVRVASHDSIPAVLASLDLTRPDTMTVAHNGNGFDFLILSEVYHVVPAHCVDTICMERWLGISRMQGETHKELTALLGHGTKEAGTVISDGKQWPDDFTRDEMLAFGQYCMNDTQQCRDNFFSMVKYMTADALLFMDITAKMACDPVLRLDDDMLTRYLAELEDQVTKARSDLMKVFSFADNATFLKAIRSSVSFTKMLETLGRQPPMKYSEAKSRTKKAKLEAQGRTDLKEEDYAVYAPSLSKADLDFAAMATDADPKVALLVQTRLGNNSSIQRSRAETFHNLAQSGRPMPVMLNAFKAHTSRYTAGNAEGSSDKLNLQNLSKRDPTQLTLRKAVQAPEGCTLVACDSSQIEARILAYVARENGLLDAFRHGADPYADLAEVIFSVPSKEIHDGAKHGDKKLKAYRNTGKTAILSAGYGVGARKYSDTLLRQGVRLSPDLDQHFETAKHAHSIYRQSNANIVNLWDRCQQVISHLYLGGEGYFGGPDDNLFHYGILPVCGGVASLPSVAGPNGYTIRYWNLQCTVNDKGRAEYSYMRPKRKEPVRIYGGAMTENICQYLAFALLQWQACRMAEHGVRIIANIHDSFLAVCPEQDAEKIKSIMEHDMSQIPDWLPGFPVACEAEIGTDYCIA